MKNFTIIQPYTDEFLKWNEATQKYELTLEFVKLAMDVNFANDSITERRIKQNTKTVYNFIKYRCYSGNSAYIDVLLNKTEEGRRFIKDVLLCQFEADNETAYNDLVKQPAIDVASGKEIDRDKLWANQVSVETEQLVYSNESYFGFNIMVRYTFPPLLKVYLKGGLNK